MEDDRIARLESALAAFDYRLRVLEEKSSGTRSTFKPPPPIPAPEVPASIAPGASRPLPIPPAQPVKSSLDSEVSSGMLLAGVGVLFFVLAASFFIKLAIDSGWLTPARQLGAAVFFGLALIGTGLKLRVKDFAYASILPAGGIVILFLSVYGGHLYWMLYSQSTAALLAATVSLFSLYLFYECKHDFYLIAAVAGSYLVPILLERGNVNVFNTSIYFILWDLAYCACAIIIGRRLLIGLTAYFAVGVWFLLFQDPLHHSAYWLSAVVFQACQFLFIVAALGYFSVERKVTLQSSEAWALSPVLLLFYATQYSTLSWAVPHLAPYLSLAFSAVLIVIYGVVRLRLNRDSLESEPVLASFVAITLFHALYLEILPNYVCPWVALALIPLLGWLPRTRFNFDRFWPVYFVIFVVIAAEYLDILFEMRPPKDQPYMLLNLLFFAALFGGYFLRRKSTASFEWIVIAAIVQLMAGLWRIAGQMAAPPVDLYLTSGSWALSAVLLLVTAYQWKDSFLGRCAVGILGIVAIKVIIVDISSSSSIARIVALLGIGALMYFAGLLWRRFGDWEKAV